MQRARWSIAVLFIVALFALVVFTQPTASTPLVDEADVPRASGSCTTYSKSGSITIPDDSATGITSTLTLPPISGKITYVRLNMGIAHTFPGDLSAYLSTANLCESEIFANQLDTQEYNGELYFANDGLKYVAYDDFPYPYVYKPNVAFSSNFRAGGRWTLHMVDSSSGDEGALTGWSVTLCTGGATPVTGPATATPTITPTPGPLPASCAGNWYHWQKPTTSPAEVCMTPESQRSAPVCSNTTSCSWEDTAVLTAPLGLEEGLAMCGTDINYELVNYTYVIDASGDALGGFVGGYTYVSAGYEQSLWHADAGSDSGYCGAYPNVWASAWVNGTSYEIEDYGPHAYFFSRNTQMNPCGDTSINKRLAIDVVSCVGMGWEPTPTPEATQTPRPPICGTPRPSSGWGIF